MDRQMTQERLRAFLGRYKYALAVVLLGVVLMLLPARSARQTTSVAEAGSRPSVQSDMEATLAAFDGVGRLRLTMTVTPGTERWEGAVVVCEGADSAAVRLTLTQALRALTGLPSDRITIVKGKP